MSTLWFQTRTRIDKLKEIRVDRGATAAEAETAKRLLYKLTANERAEAIADFKKDAKKQPRFRFHTYAEAYGWIIVHIRLPGERYGSVHVSAMHTFIPPGQGWAGWTPEQLQELCGRGWFKPTLKTTTPKKKRQRKTKVAIG